MNGRLRLVLEGEDPTKIAASTERKRIEEYYKLTWRAMGGRPRRRSHDESRLVSP